MSGCHSSLMSSCKKPSSKIRNMVKLLKGVGKSRDVFPLCKFFFALYCLFLFSFFYFHASLHSYVHLARDILHSVRFSFASYDNETWGSYITFKNISSEVRSIE